MHSGQPAMLGGPRLASVVWQRHFVIFDVSGVHDAATA